MAIFVKGIIPAMPTPLDEYGKINKTSLRRLTNFLIDSGVHGLFALGSTGEWYGFNLEQKREVIETIVDETNGRIPVYAGTGAITTRETVKITKLAAAIGVEAVSVLTPVFITPNNEEMYEHYLTVASSIDIPVILYNNPIRTGINLNIDLVEKLSKIDNIIGIKDSSGDMTLTGEYIRKTTDNFNVLAGRDTLILSTLVYGGKGAISATANIAPKIAVSIYEEYLKGDLKKALEAQYELAPLRLAFNLGSFPVVIKEGLRMIGIDVGETLKPISELTEENKAKLKKVLQDIKVL